MEDSGPNSGWAQGQRYFALGLKFAGGIIVFVLIGYGLDRWIGTLPLFTVIGTLGGAVLSFLTVYWDLAKGEKGEKDEKGKKGGT